LGPHAAGATTPRTVWVAKALSFLRLKSIPTHIVILANSTIATWAGVGFFSSKNILKNSDR
jgi:hypothetical protein